MHFFLCCCWMDIVQCTLEDSPHFNLILYETFQFEIINATRKRERVGNLYAITQRLYYTPLTDRLLKLILFYDSVFVAFNILNIQWKHWLLDWKCIVHCFIAAVSCKLKHILYIWYCEWEKEKDDYYSFRSFGSFGWSISYANTLEDDRKESDFCSAK